MGYSSLALKDGLILTQGDLDGVEQILCLKVADGSTVWAVQPEPVAAALTAKLAADQKRLDKNQDGTIDEAEALLGIGPDFFSFERADPQADVQALAAARTARIVQLLDANGDGQLSFAEAGSRFRNLFAKIDTADPAADATALAKQRTAEALPADQDGDGRLSKKEAVGTPLQEPFSRADLKEPATAQGDELLTTAEIELYFAKQEAGRDGVLSAAELTQYYQQHYPGTDGSLSAAELRGYFGG